MQNICANSMFVKWSTCVNTCKNIFQYKNFVIITYTFNITLNISVMCESRVKEGEDELDSEDILDYLDDDE